MRKIVANQPLFLILIVILIFGCAIKHYERGYSHYQRGVNLLQHSLKEQAAKEFQLAIKELDKAIDRDPALTEAYVVRGASHLNILQLDKALLNLEVAKRLGFEGDPSWVLPLTQVSIGGVYYQFGTEQRKNRAVLEKKRRAASDPKLRRNLEINMKEANIKELSFYEIAANFYEDTLKLKELPNSFAILALQQAILAHYAARGSAKPLSEEEVVQAHSKGINELSQKLIEIDSSNPIAHHFLGAALYNKSDRMSCKEALKHLLIANQVGIPNEVLQYENEDMINDLLSSLAKGESKEERCNK